MFDIQEIRKDFPALAQMIKGKPLVYLDNAASAQKPQVVLDAVQTAYAQEYSNVHRGLHTLSTIATEKYEAVRGKIARFLNAASEDEIVFTSGSTESINLAAYAWLEPQITVGDEIILSVMEHHANIVPWHFMRERHGAVLKWIDVEADGALDPQKVIDSMTERTKLIALTHMSNVLGCVVDLKPIIEAAHARGIAVLVDGSQAAVHSPVDVQTLGCDFYTITGHKLYGPSASGALYVRQDRYAQMRPWKGGGDMIREVHKDTVTYNTPPHMFEAGTPAIVQMIGLGAALDYLQAIGMDKIAGHEAELKTYAQEKLQAMDGLRLYGTTLEKGAIFSFTLEGIHAHDISTIIDNRGVAVRAGHHCAQPLMQHLGVSATCRASFGLYNTKQEVDALVEALENCQDLFA